FAIGNAPRVHVHEVVPAPGEFGARGDFDDRAGGEAIRRAAARGEDVQVHAGCQLQRAADEVARGRGGVDEAALVAPQFVAGREHLRDGRAAAFGDAAHGFLDDVRQAAGLVAGRRVGRAVDAAAREVFVVPAQFAHDGFGDLGRGGAA